MPTTASSLRQIQVRWRVVRCLSSVGEAWVFHGVTEPSSIAQEAPASLAAQPGGSLSFEIPPCHGLRVHVFGPAFFVQGLHW